MAFYLKFSFSFCQNPFGLAVYFVDFLNFFFIVFIIFSAKLQPISWPRKTIITFLQRIAASNITIETFLLIPFIKRVNIKHFGTIFANNFVFFEIE